LIGDEQEIFRCGLQFVLENAPLKNILVIGVASNGTELLEKVKKLQPDVVIANVMMPDMDGIEVCRKLKMNFRDTGIITFSNVGDLSLVFKLYDLGVRAHLLRGTSKKEIKQAVHAASMGQVFYSSHISTMMMKDLVILRQRPTKKQSISFSKRELAIIHLICKQLTLKEIGSELKLATRTVEDHSKRIKAKIGAINIVGIVLFAIKERIVKLDEVPGL
jgi:two-component system, NarL family, response regulator NreC